LQATFQWLISGGVLAIRLATPAMTTEFVHFAGHSSEVELL
jgi:hypothetical protein